MESSNLTNFFGYRTSVAEWASIASLFVSAYAAITIRSVRGQMLGRLRLPTLAAHIETETSAIAQAMDHFDENREPFELQLVKCEAHLKTLVITIRGNPRQTSKNILKLAQKYRTDKQFYSTEKRRARDNAWEIYAQLLSLIEELKYALQDQKFGG